MLTMLINLATDLLYKRGRSAGGAQVSAGAADRCRRRRHERAALEGVWHAAWRRFRGRPRRAWCRWSIVAAVPAADRAGARTRPGGTRLAEGGRRAERAANASSAPRPPERPSAIEAPKGPNVDISDVDPLAPRYKEWAERAAQMQDHRDGRAPRPCRSAATGSAATCWPRRSRAPRCRCSSACSARCSPPPIGTRARAPLGGFFGGTRRRLPRVALQRLHRDARHPADPRVRRGASAAASAAWC